MTSDFIETVHSLIYSFMYLCLPFGCPSFLSCETLVFLFCFFVVVFCFLVSLYLYAGISFAIILFNIQLNPICIE